MSAGRGSISVLLVAAGVFCSGSPTEAQQGYEFGIRFRPASFRPVNFGGFSFQQASARPANNQPIQFDRITFPAFSSRATRRGANRGRSLERGAAVPLLEEGRGRRVQRLRIAVDDAGLRTPAERKGRSRLALRSRVLVNTSRLRKPSGPYLSQSPRFSYSVESRRSPRLASRFRSGDRSGEQAVASSALSRTRREALAGRFDGDRRRTVSGESRTARLPHDRVAGTLRRGAILAR